MERIGIYSSIFNPPHIGHVRSAQHAVTALSLDKLLVVPAREPCAGPLTEASPTSEQQRQMLRLCFRSCEKVQLSDSVQCGGLRYVCETVVQLKRSCPDAELVLLMETDMFLAVSGWQGADAILADISLGVFCRGYGSEREAVIAQKMVLETKGAKVYLLENPVPEVSCPDLQRMLVFRCAGEFLVPDVWSYILENGLYGTGCDLRGLPMAELERAVVRLLKPNRVAHVLGCRDTAAELARIWGADETDAARAGLLHDITKALDGPLQLTLCQAYGIILNNFSIQNPKTLHALTGSLVAEQVFGENEAVVSAIRSHTTGKANMNMLEKIIYVADYVEPNRDFPGVEELRRLAHTDIDSALKLGLQMTLSMLRQQGKEISVESEQALSWLEDKQG